MEQKTAAKLAYLAVAALIFVPAMFGDYTALQNVESVFTQLFTLLGGVQ